MWSKNGGDNQKWTFEDDFTIKSGLNFVLDVKDASKDNHTNLLAFSGHGGENQKFRVVPVNDDWAITRFLLYIQTLIDDTSFLYK